MSVFNAGCFYDTIDFSSTSILVMATGYMDHMIKEALEIRLHSRNFNGDGGFTLSQPWYPVTKMFKQYRDPPFQRQAQTKQSTHSAHQTPIGSLSESSAGSETSLIFYGTGTADNRTKFC